MSDLERFEEAVACYRRALALKPEQHKTLLNLGFALQTLSRQEEALGCYEQILALQPDHPKALANRGVALLAMNRIEEALDSYVRALSADPANPEAHFNLGFALQELGRHADALASYERALAIRPDYPDALSNRGTTLQYFRRYDEALACYDRALALAPDSIEALSNRGSVLQDMERFEDALISYAKAQEVQPEHPDAHWNDSLCRLKMGDYGRSWRKYEWRWKTGQRGQQRDFPQPLWLGDAPLTGKTILLHAEQGIGDTLQFCRYARQVAALGARVILEVQPPLISVLTGVQGVQQLLARGDMLPTFDYHCPLLSLPLAFSTQLNTIPAERSYLSADPQRVSRWQNELGTSTGPRVGLVWSGRLDQSNDHNRSIPLAELTGLASHSAQLVGLQRDIRAADREILNARKDILCFEEDFAETAALIELMDVVISVDTSIAHLAGALGKPVWLLLPRNPDWRWLLKRKDSPWYPSVRLFRQQKPGDWSGAIAAVGTELACLCADRAGGTPGNTRNG